MENTLEESDRENGDRREENLREGDEIIRKKRKSRWTWKQK